MPFRKPSLNPLHYFGPNALDRTHMFTFSGSFDFVGGLQLSMITRIYSALPQTLTIPLQGSCLRRRMVDGPYGFWTVVTAIASFRCDKTSRPLGWSFPEVS